MGITSVLITRGIFFALIYVFLFPSVSLSMIEEGERRENQRKTVYFVPEEERRSATQQASISLPSDIWRAKVFSYLSTEDTSQLWRVSTLFSSLLEYGVTTVDFLPNLRRGFVLPWVTIQNVRLDIKACRVLDLRQFFICVEHLENLESIVLTHGELDIWAHERLNSKDAGRLVAIFDKKAAGFSSLRTLDLSNNLY